MSDNNDGVEIPVVATPEWLATGGVVGEDGYVVLRYKNGIPLARVNGDLLSCKPGKEEATMRAWLAGWIRDGYEAGYAAAADGKAIAAYQRVFRWCHGECLGDVNPADPDEKAAHAAVVFLREELAVARQRVKERDVETEQVRRANERLSAKVYGQDQPDGDALRKAREEGRAEAFGRVVEWCQDGVSWDCLDVSIAEAAAREAVASLRIRAEDDEQVREEGRKEAFLKVVKWCRSDLPEGIDVSADDAEEVAEDALGRLQQAAADGDARVREEGRRLGWQEALAAVAKAHEAERKDADRAAEMAERARSAAYEAENLQQLLLMRSVATEALLSVVTAAAPKEPT